MPKIHRQRGTVKLLVLPPVLGFSRPRAWLPRYLRFDGKAVLAGLLSFALFAALAALLSLAMGIWVGDLSAAFARPDHGPDPDVIGWGVLTVRARSVLPAMVAHYLVDSLGQIFLGVDASNPALSTGFFLLLTLTYPVANVLLARALYRQAAQ